MVSEPPKTFGFAKSKVPAPSFVRPKVELFCAFPTSVKVVAAFVTSIELSAVTKNARSVLADVPVYWRLPPFSLSKFAAAVAAPKLLARLPLVMVATLSVPEVMVTPPVKVFVPVKAMTVPG